jgi:membrane protein implicated in regulation of membrane protease activity
MIAAGVLAVGEMFTLGFFAGPIAIAAALAAVTALAGGGLAAQWIVFIAASLGSLLVLRPIARRHLRTPAQLRTGTAALVGAPAIVLERALVRRGRVVRARHSRRSPEDRRRHGARLGIGGWALWPL